MNCNVGEFLFLKHKQQNKKNETTNSHKQTIIHQIIIPNAISISFWPSFWLDLACFSFLTHFDSFLLPVAESFAVGALEIYWVDCFTSSRLLIYALRVIFVATSKALLHSWDIRKSYKTNFLFFVELVGRITTILIWIFKLWGALCRKQSASAGNCCAYIKQWGLGIDW